MVAYSDFGIYAGAVAAKVRRNSAERRAAWRYRVCAGIIMYRHEPESPLFRVHAVQTKSQGVVSGTMPARVGMVLAHNVGTVVRVNEKSIVIRQGTIEWRESHPVSVTREEARRHGYPQRVPSAK